jgi:hypothetical protein
VECAVILDAARIKGFSPLLVSAHAEIA